MSTYALDKLKYKISWSSVNFITLYFGGICHWVEVILRCFKVRHSKRTKIGPIVWLVYPNQREIYAPNSGNQLINPLETCIQKEKDLWMSRRSQLSFRCIRLRRFVAYMWNRANISIYFGSGLRGKTWWYESETWLVNQPLYGDCSGKKSMNFEHLSKSTNIGQFCEHIPMDFH